MSEQSSEPEIDMTGAQGGPKPQQQAEMGGQESKGSKGNEAAEAKPDAVLGGENDERARGEQAAKDREQIFGLYREALENADWAYKPKTGTERDIGHKSVVLAERAYVAAGLYDKAEADRMYEQATGKPPKPDLQQRLTDAQGIDPAKGIADLSAGLGSLREKQELWSLTLNKNQIEKQMGNWEVAIGDAAERKRNHQKQAADELLKPERPDRGDDSGLDMFLRSIKNGYKAGKDWKMAGAHAKKHRDLQDNIRGSTAEHGDLVKKIAEFTQEQGAGIGPTVGPAGRNAQRFPGAVGIVASVLSSVGRAAKGPEAEAEKDGQAPKVSVETAKRSSILAAMSQGQGNGIGM